jgi:hypothetical protein
MKGPGAGDRPRPRAGLAFALALLLVPGGCSFRAMRPPPPRSTWPEPVLPDSSEERCTDSVYPPVADTTIAAVAGTLAFVERNSVEFRLDREPDPAHPGMFTNTYVAQPSYVGRGVAVVLGVGALIAAASAVYGYVNASRCKHYKALFHP